MDTLRVDICYRPLRIGWAIRGGDIEAFRRAVRLSYALWGGRFNPILLADRNEEATALIDLFRIDLVMPVDESDELKTFVSRFPHLIRPFSPNSLFVGDANKGRHAQALDVHNLLVHLRDTPELGIIKDRGLRLYTWGSGDPLADVFLVQFGAYPSVEEIGVDYRGMLLQAAQGTEYPLDSTSAIPLDVLERLTISYLSRHGLRRHYSVPAGSDSPGFFVGDSTNVGDLVCHWNLRAADIPLWFVDPNHLERYSKILPEWEKRMRELVSRRHAFDRHVAVWSREQNIDKARAPFGDLDLLMCGVSIDSWNGRNVRPPMMHFGQVSALGVVGQERARPRVSFPLNDKPFAGDVWFHSQHLVASLSFVSSLRVDAQHTLRPPYIPELNEFFSRTMQIEYNKLRVEPERIGLVIDAADTDGFLYALPVADLFERVFDMGGLLATPSAGGLIARQLVARLGGLQGGRAFKIPGVRRLIRTHGPLAAFTKKSALQLIASKDPDNPDVKFDDHRDLYIEPRPSGRQLTPDAVFSYLVEKGLFRMGTELRCPSCRMASWTPLETLGQRVTCELCGQEYDATRQLVNGEWYYRRSSLLGAERNAQGAIPVVLTLQQLETAFHGSLGGDLYSPSLDLRPKGRADVPPCELDFVWLVARTYPRKTAVILGECKDRGPIKLAEFAKDVENLRRVVQALPRRRFKPFVLLAKLSPFTPEEIACAKTLNDEYRQRTILLTDRELEPYHIYDRTKLEASIDRYAGTPEDLARITASMYFGEPTSDGWELRA
jgi:hypothetical protein